MSSSKMICQKLLLNLFILISLKYTKIQCQDYEGVRDVLAQHWACQFGGNDYQYGDYVCKYYDLYYGAYFPGTPEPIEIFPNFACHPGFDMSEYRSMHEDNMNQLGPGPNTPINQADLDFCPKFNIIYREWDSNTFDLLAFDDVQEGDAAYDPNYVDGNRKYWFKDSSDRLNQMFGEELGGELMTKIKNDCQQLLFNTFYVDGRQCSDPEAEEVYDCVNNAVGC